MNILPFVFAVLIILSYGTAASFQSRIASRRNQKAHLGLRKTELSFLRQSEREHYNELPGIPVKIPKAEKNSAPSEPSTEQTQINPLCARINLFPLIEQGRNEHPNLYETAAKLLRTFYQTTVFENEKGLEYKLLDAILAAGKRSLTEEISLPIETLDLRNSDLQTIFYTLLKGTKKCTLGEKGFPPLIDYLKIERKTTHVCLFDSHLHMLSVFFGPKTAPILFEELRNGQKQTIDLDTIIQLTNDPHLAFIDPAVWNLLNFNRPTHGGASRRTLITEDAETGISLRKDIHIKIK